MTAPLDPLDRVLELLEGVRRDGNGWSARCPAHEDHRASLSVARGDHQPCILFCHVGCEVGDVVAALGLTMADIGAPNADRRDTWRVAGGAVHDIEQHRQTRQRVEQTPKATAKPTQLGKLVATYTYRDEHGEPLFEKLRYDPKDFRVRRPNGGGWGIGDARPVLYNLHQVTAAIADGQTIVLCEGEKDADRAVAEEGIVATTLYEGASKSTQRAKWRPEYTEQLRGANVVVVADRDDAGIAHAQAAAAAIAGTAAKVWIRLPVPDFAKADLSDHFDAGHSIRELVPFEQPHDNPGTHADQQPQPAYEQQRRDEPLANLPADFWAARPALTHIRQAAHHRGRSADLVLHACLARLSAMVSPELQFDTGLADGSLNYFAAAVGPSGIGKSTGADLAQQLLGVPRYLRPADDTTRKFRDGLPIGSGEGLVEAYMGTGHVETGEYTKNGDPKTEKVRMQVRENVFAFVDEGESLTKMGERSGATIGPILRAAWAGQLLGQANAREETTRILERRSYSLGLLIGFQRTTCQPLLADGAAGTPQRFAWCSAMDPSVPDDPPEHPGPLNVRLEDGFSPTTGMITFDESIRRGLWANQIARQRGELAEDDLDSHKPLAMSKTAALLSVLDGRRHVTTDDWALADTLWKTSAAVRDALVSSARRETAKQEWIKVQRQKEQAVATAAEVATLPSRLSRIAKNLARYVADGALMHQEARQKLANRDRSLYDAAVQQGVDDGVLARWDRGIAPATTPAA